VPKVYSWRFNVRSYELDVSGQVAPPTFLNYLEEGAVQASAAEGYDHNWYFANNRMWVVRKMTMRYFSPAVITDELALYTWVSDFRRVQSNREYDLRRASDDEPIVRARGNWVFMNTETMQPQRIPPEVIEEFAPTGEDEDLDAAVNDPIVVEEPIIHTEERRVQRHELDSQGHVNNSIYLAWAEQSVTNALRTAGWPPERFDDSEFAIRPHASEIEYFRSAMDDEPIWIVTRLAEVARDRAAWHNEIRHGATGELIAKAILVRAFTDAVGPRSIPDALQLALVQHSKV
jgi:YbgC/YbaW family acyl-CoA thioester hydrolase